MSGIEKMRAAQLLKRKHPDLYEKVQPFYDRLTIKQIQRIAYNGKSGMDKVLEEVKKANPPKKDTSKLGKGKLKLTTGYEGYDPEEAARKTMESRKPKDAPVTGGVLAGPSEDTLREVQYAKTRLENRAVGSKKFLTDQEIRDIRLLQKHSPDWIGSTRYFKDSDYKKFDKLVFDYNSEIKKIARTIHNPASSAYDQFLADNLWDRGHLIPKVTQPHKHNLNSNISTENAVRNKDSKAVTTFGDMVNFMERGDGLPVRRMQEWQELGALTNSLEKSGYDTRNLRRIMDNLSLYPMFEPVIGKNSEIGRLPIINSAGSPRSFKDMYDDPKGVLSKDIDTAKAEYEKLRRLAITMMAENPEWDLNGMVQTRRIPNEFLNGQKSSKYPDRVSLAEIAQGNANVGDGMFRTRAGGAEALKRGGGRLSAALTLLAASGAVFAQDEDPMDESTWSEATMNRVTRAMEQLGQYEQAGIGAIQQAIPGATQVGQAYNQGIDFLNWGKGQQTSAPVVYDESGQPTFGGTWNATKGAGDYIDFGRQIVVPVEDAALGLGLLHSWFSPVAREEDTISP